MSRPPPTALLAQLIFIRLRSRAFKLPIQTPHKKEQYGSLTLKPEWMPFHWCTTPNGCARADSTCRCQEGHMGA